MAKRLLCVMLLLLASVLLVSGCSTGAFQVQIVPDKKVLVETCIGQDRGFFVRDKIAVIDVDGVMVNKQQDRWMRQGDNPVSIFQEKLDAAESDGDVKALVIRLNSPGGSVAASDMMYHSLMEFKQRTDKPVVACMMGLACSGAYYLACGSDGIVAQPATVTGSIGTIMQTVSVKGTMDKIGIKAVAIKSGDLKDIASPLDNLGDDEKKVLQGIIDQFYEQFLDVVQEGRPGIAEDKLRKLADGRVYTAQQAKEQGLVDRIGYPADAVKWAKEMAGVTKAKTVIYHRQMSTMPNIYGSAMSEGSVGPLINIDLPDWLNSGRTQFLYMWQGGL